MNPHISLPRHQAHFGSLPARSSASRVPPFFRRLVKFPQMDFEMAVWEMTTLLVAPKKVFKSMYYHKQTKNTWHRPDPSFAYLLSFFLVLTSLAWGLAYTPSVGAVARLALLFVGVHFLGSSLVVAGVAYCCVGRVFGPGGLGARLLGRPRRRGGLFTPLDDGDAVEFGYCFDVANRAFFPLYLHLYVVQFILLPLLTRSSFVATLLGNSLYLSALAYYVYITFLGYHALPSLQHTELLLAPVLVLGLLWVVSLLCSWGVVAHGGVRGLFWGV